MKNQSSISNKWVIAFFLIVTILLFWPFFRHGMYPTPHNYMTAWYEPWRSYNSSDGHLTIAHKAVADDVFRSIYPFKKLASDLVIRGEWPLWNPYNGSGQPLLAAMLPGILNPVSFLLLRFGGLGWSIFIVIQPLLLGLATYLYCRSRAISKRGSLIGSTILVFSGFAVTRYIFGDYGYALICLPVFLFLFEKFKASQKWIWLTFVPWVVTGLILTSHPQIVLYVLAFTSVYVVVMKNKLSGWQLMQFFLTMGLGMVGAAVQLIPTIELFKNANLSTQSSGFIMDRFLLPVTHFVTILIPNYFGNQGTYNWWGSGDYIETVVSLGLVPTVLALCALKKNRLVMFYLSVIVFTYLASINWIGTQLFYRLPIPILSTGVPSRIFLLTTFSISILAGIGFDQLMVTKRIPRAIFVCFISGIGAIVAYSFYLYQIHAPCPTVQVLNCRTIAIRNSLIELLALGIFFFAVLIRKWHKRIVLFTLTLLIIVALGGYNATKFLPFSPPSAWYPQTGLTTFLEQKTLPWRVMGISGAQISTDLASQFRVFDPNNYDPLYVRRYGELVAFANSENHIINPSRSDVNIDASATPSGVIAFQRERLWDLLSVKYLIAPATHPIVENPVWHDSVWQVGERSSALPRAYLVNHVEVIATSDVILNRLFSTDFSPATNAIVETPLGIKNWASNIGTVTMQTISEQHVTIKVAGDGTQLLVITDTYYPGWRASVDGKEVPIYRTNYALRGIIVPAGAHVVKLWYAPQSLAIGGLISLFAFVIWSVWVVYKWKKSCGG